MLASTTTKTIRPMATAKYTEMDRSFPLIMLKSPVMKAAIPLIPVRSIGIAREGLLKNVSPPCCPNKTLTLKIPINAARVTSSQAERLPNLVLGLK